MNWAAVRRANQRASARKAKGERLAAAFKARVEKAGGQITSAEVRAATTRNESPAPGYSHDRLVWTFRGRDWVLGYSDGEQWQSFAPFQSWRQDADTREAVPLTPGARKTLAVRLAEMFPEE